MAIEKIREWDWPDYRVVYRDYVNEAEPILSADNMMMMAEKINEIIEFLEQDGSEKT